MRWRSSGVGQRLGADVAYQQVYLAHVAVFGEVDNLFDVIGLEHDAAQSCQGSAAYADASDVPYLVVIAFYERYYRFHAHHDHAVELALIGRPVRRPRIPSLFEAGSP